MWNCFKIFAVLKCISFGEGQSEGDLRLVDVVGETNTEEGRLEIYHNSTWGTVCNDLFGTSDAIVACRQLGYRASYVRFYTAGGGRNQIWLDDLKCSGLEKRLDGCDHGEWGQNNCAHIEDIGINCTVDGHWSSWTPWTICSLSCDSGYQSRHRHCNNPPPSLNRPYCYGKPFEILNCSITKCPGNKRQGTEDTSKSFSIEAIVGVAVGCICITAVIIFITLFVFRRFISVQVENNQKICSNNQDLGTLGDTIRPTSYEYIESSNVTPPGVYDTCDIKESGYGTAQ
ncbi:neurotrypsin-like [Mytilus edulis]|uniref:neurotrypsin-like n=1 Tax=Mytilus edulis TaxID=6550 RepID=UPI0039F0C955